MNAEPNTWFDETRVHLSSDGTISVLRDADAGGAAATMAASLGARTYMRHIKLTKVGGPAWPSALPLDAGTGLPALAAVPNEVQPLIDAVHDRGMKFIAYVSGFLDTLVASMFPDEVAFKMYSNPAETDIYYYLPFRFTNVPFLDVTAEPLRTIWLTRLLELAAMGADGFNFDEVWHPKEGGYQTAVQDAYEAAGLPLPVHIQVVESRRPQSQYIKFAGDWLGETLHYWREAVQAQYPGVFFIMSGTTVPNMINIRYSTDFLRGFDVIKEEFRRSGKRTIEHIFTPVADLPTHFGFYGVSAPALAPPPDLHEAAGYALLRDIGFKKHPPRLWSAPFASQLQYDTFVSTVLGYGAIVNLQLNQAYLKAPNTFTPEIRGWLTGAVEFGIRFGAELKRDSTVRFAGIHFAEAARNTRVLGGTTNEHRRDRSILAWNEVLARSMAAFGYFCRRGMPVGFVTDSQLEEGELTGFKFLFIGNPDDLTAGQTAAVEAFEDEGGVVYSAPGSGVDWPALAVDPLSEDSPLPAAISSLEPDTLIVSQSTNGRAHVLAHDTATGGLIIVVLNYFSWLSVRDAEIYAEGEDTGEIGDLDPPDSPVDVTIQLNLPNTDFVAKDFTTGAAIPLNRTGNFVTFTVPAVRAAKFIKIGVPVAAAPALRRAPFSAMRMVNFRDGVLFPIASALHIDTDFDLMKDHARQWCHSINRHLVKGWRFWQWPELTLTEERCFRAKWRAETQFINGDEVFYIPTWSYFRAIADPPPGTLPTDLNYYEPVTLSDRHLIYDQPCERMIGDVIGIYGSNPRLNGGIGTRGLDFQPSEKGVDITPFAGGNTVFVHYRRRCPKFTTELYDPDRSYARGSLIYWSDGDVYRAVTAAGPTQDPTSLYWTRVPFPELLAEYTINAACADAAEDEQAKLDFLAAAKASLQFEVDRLYEQGTRTFYQMGRRRQPVSVPYGVSGFWWSVSAPWSDTSGVVSTLTDECLDAEFGIGPTAEELANLTGLMSLDLEGLTGGGPTKLDGVDTDALGLTPPVTLDVTIDGNTRIYQLQIGAPGANDISVLNHIDYRWRRTGL